MNDIKTEIVIFFGPPASGKGSIINYIKKHIKDCVTFSPGTILRDIIDNHKEHNSYKTIKNSLEQGKLVSKDVLDEVVKHFILNNRNKILLFDGYPRNIQQNNYLKKIIKNNDISLKFIFHIKCQRDLLIRRIENRLSCTKCSRIYNKLYNEPKKQNICNSCRIPLISRDDDNQKIFQKRYKIYIQMTLPVVKEYVAKSNFYVISPHIKKASKLIKELFIK